jgi:hypothetical protein
MHNDSFSMASMYEAEILGRGKDAAAEPLDVAPPGATSPAPSTKPDVAHAAPVVTPPAPNTPMIPPDAAAAASATLTCAWCRAAGKKLMRCTGCKAAWFCDKGCLREGWTKGGHKQACAAIASTAAVSRAVQPKEQPKQQPKKPQTLPPAMTETPTWAGGGGGGGSSGGGSGPAAGMLQYSDSFDRQPLDEDDECAACRGDPLARSGVGVVHLACAHRLHRACVAGLRGHGVASPCPECDPDGGFLPPWDAALRLATRVSQRRNVNGRRLALRLSFFLLWVRDAHVRGPPLPKQRARVPRPPTFLEPFQGADPRLPPPPLPLLS